jgi:hypothetical protein
MGKALGILVGLAAAVGVGIALTRPAGASPEQPPPPAPVAHFNLDKTSGTPPLSVIFTDDSTGSITTRSWDFGDGSPILAETSPTHIFPEGTFQVTLTVTGPGGSSSFGATVTVALATTGAFCSIYNTDPPVCFDEFFKLMDYILNNHPNCCPYGDNACFPTFDEMADHIRATHPGARVPIKIF